MYSTQRGNLLFLILLAVFLFAALSYAVIGNERGQVKNASSENAATVAAQIIQQASLIDNTVSRLRLSGGCSETQISFENPTVAGYTNPNAPTDKRCHVFDLAGGGLSYPPPVIDQFIVNNTWIATVSSWWTQYRGRFVFSANANAYPPSGFDLVLFVPFISLQLCREIQKSVNGTQNIPSNRDISIPSIPFVGTYGSVIRDPPVNDRTGCVLKNDDGYYSFYQVLIAR